MVADIRAGPNSGATSAFVGGLLLQVYQPDSGPEENLNVFSETFRDVDHPFS